MQATGRDARGRKQYRYHAAWRKQRDEDKYGRLADFARALPGIRRRVRADLRLPGLPRDKVIAAVVSLLERTFIRVGNERYARENGSYGLTTLRNHHVGVAGGRIRFRFRGKSGKRHAVELDDAQLARIIRRCRDLPGYELFQYLEGGTPRSVDSDDINAYLQRITGRDYSAKDFRTWGGDPGEAGDRRSDPRDGRGAGQHGGDLPQVLRAPARARLLPFGQARGEVGVGAPGVRAEQHRMRHPRRHRERALARQFNPRRIPSLCRTNPWRAGCGAPSPSG